MLSHQKYAHYTLHINKKLKTNYLNTTVTKVKHSRYVEKNANDNEKPVKNVIVLDEEKYI